MTPQENKTCALIEQEYQNELLKKIDLNISAVVENKVEPSSNDCWTRCHRLSSEKDKNAAISKTFKKRKIFKQKLLVYRFEYHQKKCYNNTYKKNIHSRKGQRSSVPLVLVVTAII